MSEELSRLQRDVAYLMDRQAILDCIAQNARGQDRRDVDLLTATYHTDGVDEHGNTVNPGPAYAEWANAAHARSSSTHLHNVTTHLCEIDGEVAHCESYVMVVLLSPDEATTTIMCGRYVDRLEKRDDAWRIAVRRTTLEAVATGDASILHQPFFRAQGYPRGAFDEGDLSYQRPVTLDGPEPTRW